MPTNSSPAHADTKVVDAVVVGNDRICQDHFRLILAVEHFAPAVPGQFIQLRCSEALELQPPAKHDWPDDQPPRLVAGELSEPAALLRRPFGLAGVYQVGPNGRTHLHLIYRVLGPGTRWLARLHAGARLNLVGPLGKGFWIRQDKSLAWLISGGIGFPPLLWLADSLCQAGKTVLAFCGARTADLLPLTRSSKHASRDDPLLPALRCEELANSGVPAVLATDDGSAGFRGLVSKAFARYCRRHPDQQQAAAVYACGPEPMLETIARFCARKAMPLQVCVERLMACGMGACQSCIVPIKDQTSDPGWRYSLSCLDGPVYDASTILWHVK